MKPFIRRLFAFLIIAILALTISIVSYYFLIGQDVKKEKVIVEVKVTVFKEDGVGGWIPITNSGEVIDGYINFECNITNYDKIKSKSLNITLVEFYLSKLVPDVQDPHPEEWILIKTFNEENNHYLYILNGRSLPDDVWYFITRVVDSQNKSTYDTYDISDLLIPFSIEHFDDSITINYLDTNGRINHNSHIGFVPYPYFEQFIESVDLFIVYNGTPEKLTVTPIDYSEITSNYNLLSLEMLSSWIESNSILPDEHNVSFVVTLHLNYSENFPAYHHDYDLPSIILDLKGPEITFHEYSFILGATYWDPWDYILSALINYTASDFSHLTLEYMYDIWYPEGEWVLYSTFSGAPPVLISFNILNLRDDKIRLRFTAYDDLGNIFTLEGPDYWIIKDMNNHLDFGLEGMSDYYFYTLSEGMIDLRLTVYPYDNDITKVLVRTDYEVFELTNVNIEGDHIFFTEEGDVDIKLDPVYYNIYGSLFTAITIELILYQGSTYITSKDIPILATYVTFQDKVNISNIEIDPNITQSDNIWMSFTTGTDSYKNSHEIPYIANNNSPIVKIYNSQDILVDTITLSPDYDDIGYNNTFGATVKIQNKFFNLSLTHLEEICTVDAIAILGVYYEFNYFIEDSETVYIQLLTGEPVDGIYYYREISMNYTLSNVMHNDTQYKSNFNFQSLAPDNYSIIGEFYDISGRISTLTINIDSLEYLLNDIVIITPENKTYTTLLGTGSYPATYSFEYDDDYSEPEGWILSNPQGTDVMVFPEIQGHKKVLRLADGHPNDEAQAYNYFNPQLYGIVEYWWLADDITDRQFSIVLQNSSGPWGIVFGFLNNNFYYYYGINHIIAPASSNQWYHIRIDFRCTGAAPYNGLNKSRYFIYIDGIRYGEYNFTNPIAEINVCIFTSGARSYFTALMEEYFMVSAMKCVLGKHFSEKCWKTTNSAYQGNEL